MIDAKFHKSELKTSDFINSFMGPLFFETVGIICTKAFFKVKMKDKLSYNNMHKSIFFKIKMKDKLLQ